MTVEITAALIDWLEGDATLAALMGGAPGDTRIMDAEPDRIVSLTATQPAYLVVTEGHEEAITADGHDLTVALGDQRYELICVANSARRCRQLRDRIREQLVGRSMTTTSYLVGEVRYDGSQPIMTGADQRRRLRVQLTLAGQLRKTALDLSDA